MSHEKYENMKKILRGFLKLLNISRFYHPPTVNIERKTEIISEVQIE